MIKIDFCQTFEILNGLDVYTKKLLTDEIAKTLSFENEEDINLVNIETFILYTCIKCGAIEDISKFKLAGYGAGNMAEKYATQINRSNPIDEIWDAYSGKKDVSGIKVERPNDELSRTDRLFIIFIDDAYVRYSAKQNITSHGYKDFLYFRDYLRIVDDFAIYDKFEYTISDNTIETINEISNRYVYLDNEYIHTFFTTYDKKTATVGKIGNPSIVDHDVLAKTLYSKLIFDKTTAEELCAISRGYLSDTDSKTALELAIAIEKFAQRILQGRVKTKIRPMKMADDFPYDPFVLFEVFDCILKMLYEQDIYSAIEFTDFFEVNSKDNIVILSIKANLLNSIGRYEEALENARRAVVVNTNSLLANECFYITAAECKKAGIYVEEPIPEYDMSEYFCWSGISFAWCGGFDEKTEKAVFGPCFRPLQCAARPEGEMWTGEDWKEFRKSVTDGSFRYCQKNQCPNIVSGWLPKKKDIVDENLFNLVNGDTDIVMPLDELHLSYDGHCNLKCPSCRLEYRTNNQAQNLQFDRLYEKNIKDLVKCAKHLCLSGCGEALISPHSRSILKSLSPGEYPELEVELRTNMTVLNRKTWEELGEGRKCVKHIAASIDSCTKANFEKIRYPAKWDTVLDNLKFVQELRKNGEIEMFEFHVVVQKDNVNELVDIVKLAMSLDADCVTFSRLINWRNIPEEEYHEINPFWPDNELHSLLIEQWNSLIKLRNDIENGRSGLVDKKFYLNLHFVPDPGESYKEIRTGKYRIR